MYTHTYIFICPHLCTSVYIPTCILHVYKDTYLRLNEGGGFLRHLLNGLARTQSFVDNAERHACSSGHGRGRREMGGINYMYVSTHMKSHDIHTLSFHHITYTLSLSHTHCHSLSYTHSLSLSLSNTHT